MAERFFNQRNILNQDKLSELSFLVIGAGAIGSTFVTNIAKMGAKKVVVFDHDTLEEHNFDSQMYPFSGLGRPKVEVLKEVAKAYGDVDIDARNERWTADSAVEADVVVVCVDNMDVRKTIWNHYKANPKVKFFLEGRMSALAYRVYGIDTANEVAKALYETTLYPQAEAAAEPCGEKSIIFTVIHIASQMCSQVKKWVMGEYRPTEVQYDYWMDKSVTTYNMDLVPEVLPEVPDEV